MTTQTHTPEMPEDHEDFASLLAKGIDEIRSDRALFLAQRDALMEALKACVESIDELELPHDQWLPVERRREAALDKARAAIASVQP